MSRGHDVNWSDVWWEWAQKESGLMNPAPFFRDIVTAYALKIGRNPEESPEGVSEVVISEAIPEVSAEMQARLKELGVFIEFPQMDRTANDAVQWGIKGCNNSIDKFCDMLDEQKRRGIRDVRAWLISEYLKTL